MPVLKIYKDGEWQSISGGSATDMTEKIYKQNEEPADAPDGSLWVDTDEEGGGNFGGKCSVPEITAEAEGAFLCVINGEAKWQVIPDAEGVGF